MKHNDGGVDFSELTTEHLEYIEAAQIRMAHRGSMTASAENARAWFAEKWGQWQARQLLDSLTKE